MRRLIGLMWYWRFGWTLWPVRHQLGKFRWFTLLWNGHITLRALNIIIIYYNWACLCCSFEHPAGLRDSGCCLFGFPIDFQAHTPRQTHTHSHSPRRLHHFIYYFLIIIPRMLFILWNAVSWFESTLRLDCASNLDFNCLMMLTLDKWFISLVGN